MIKSFSGQVVFCFAILRAMSAYVGENLLSQYIFFFASIHTDGLKKRKTYVPLYFSKGS